MLASAGCPSPLPDVSKNDETTDGAETTSTSAGQTGSGDTTEGDTTGPPSATTGWPDGPRTLLLVVDTSLLPRTPLQAIVHTNPGEGTVDLTLQFLSLDPGSKTTPRLLVGEVYDYAGVAVNGDGSFDWDMGEVFIPGEANPGTGADVTTTVQLHAVLAGDPVFCGTVAGMVSDPLPYDLEGSTHAMIEVPDAMTLPIEFPVACP
ncbi:hypothetical protein [Paraliomyxa miuraensis]|uniref:hypothetical protein n=1 Tax=Paraliomyxa miuraensis TaxID=376150 RepID=UPI002255380D|nr:hypothetical protein [Paraliomyxa miuraensis]MCX4243860.1 hypothetical protein [Paraliomyxa miuraensis]